MTETVQNETSSIQSGGSVPFLVKKKRKNKMADSTPEVKVPEIEEIVVKRKLFDLSTFAPVSKEEKVSFTAAKDMAEFLTRIGNDSEKALKVANAGLRRLAISEAKKEMGGENLVSPKVISVVINQFRPNYPLDPKLPEKEARKVQAQQVFKMLSENEALKNAVVLIAKATVPPEDEDDDEEDGATE